MTMSADVPSGGFRSFLAAPALRIAIPAWGRAEVREIPTRPALSREEVARLFEGDLLPAPPVPRAVSEAERQRKAALRIRRALYG
jgi:hypothetical protein